MNVLISDGNTLAFMPIKDLIDVLNDSGLPWVRRGKEILIHGHEEDIILEVVSWLW